MSAGTTPSGIPIVDCDECGYQHPSARDHCPGCGLATLFGHEACARPAYTEPDLFEVCS